LWRRPRPKLGCGAKERRRRRFSSLVRTTTSIHLFVPLKEIQEVYLGSNENFLLKALIF
jgi:hypothetical protein